MKQLLLLTTLSCLWLATGVHSQTAASPKKGIGLSEKHGLGTRQLNDLDVAWYYNWGSATKLQTKAKFVPMIFGEKRLNDSVSGDVVLGYNEPDHEKQANVPVKEALTDWPKIAAKARLVGSPSMAGNPVTSEWFHSFMQAKPKVDFITVHWYKGADAKHFIRDMEEVHAKFEKPLWITEFAPQTAASSAKEPNKYTHAQVAKFISETVQWMEITPWVHRYAWHDSKTGTSSLFDESGSLTATGKSYAAAMHATK